MDRNAGNQVATQTNQMPAFQAGHVADIMGNARNLYQQGGPRYFPGQTYVNPAAETNDALSATAQKARSMQPMVTGMGAELGKTIGGDYLNANPYLDATYGRAARAVERNFNESVMPGVNSTFSLAGRYGSNAHRTAMDQATDSLGRSLGEMASDIYGANYANERGKQIQAMALAPSTMGAMFMPEQQLAGVGASREDIASLPLQEQIARFNFEQQAPANNLAQYLQFVSGNYGGTSTQTQPLYRNPYAGALGGALVGSQIGQSTGVGGLGGAGLGALLGFL